MRGTVVLYEDIRNGRGVFEAGAVMRCAEGLKVWLGLHQGLALSLSLFAMVMDRLMKLSRSLCGL